MKGDGEEVSLPGGARQWRMRLWLWLGEMEGTSFWTEGESEKLEHSGFRNGWDVKSNLKTGELWTVWHNWGSKNSWRQSWCLELGFSRPGELQRAAVTLAHERLWAIAWNRFCFQAVFYAPATAWSTVEWPAFKAKNRMHKALVNITKLSSRKILPIYIPTNREWMYFLTNSWPQ